MRVKVQSPQEALAWTGRRLKNSRNVVLDRVNWMRSLGRAVLVCAWWLVAAGSWPAWAQTVTFVQLTDAHLFDAGKHRPVQAGYQDYLDNRSSFEWAVRRGTAGLDPGNGRPDSQLLMAYRRSSNKVSHFYRSLAPGCE
jgi:hypothetical protein